MSVVSDFSLGLSGYQCRLPSFEGPLDVLLRFIERDKLAITDVSLVAVTDQFLRFVADMEDVSPLVVAEFAAVGARLVLLKSRSLLPRPPAPDDEGSPDDLVRQLVEYRRYKEAAAQLGSLLAADAALFERGGSVARPKQAQSLTLGLHQPGLLSRSLKRRLSLVPRPAGLFTQRPRIPLRAMAVRIGALLQGQRRFRFGQIAKADEGRDGSIAAFLAMLALLRRNVVRAEQNELFGDIQVIATARNIQVTFDEDTFDGI